MVVVGDDRASRVHPFRGQAALCQRGGNDTRAEQLTSRGHDVERARRHLAKHGERLRKGNEIIELRIDASPEVAGGVLRRERVRRRQVAFAQLLET